MQLILDDLGGILFALVELLHPLEHALVVVLHLDLVVFGPALVDGDLLLLAALLEFDLGVSLLKDIAHQHLRVEGLHFVLIVVHLLRCVLQGCFTLGLVEGFFFLINTTSFKL